MIDLTVKEDECGKYDLMLDNSGDLATTQTLDSAILSSLFTDERADESEVPSACRRRGWWAAKEAVPGGIFGSKLWLLEQYRRLDDGAQKAVDFARQALAWLAEDGFCREVNVSSYTSAKGLVLDITFSGAVSPVNVELWRKYNA